MIIGQGICGTWLSYYLIEAGKSVVIFDDEDKSSASYIASGLINPVTGRRVVTTWMADGLLPFVRAAYNAIGNKVNTQLIQQKNILIFPSAPDLMLAFNKRLQEGNSYIHQPSIQKEQLHSYFNFPFDVSEIAPCYLVDVHALIKSWRKFLKGINTLHNETFDENELSIFDDCISYKNMQAKKIIYCNGIQSSQSNYWKNLPFVQNKGQALIAAIPGLNGNYTYKFGYLSLIAWQNDLWWIGSSNELNFDSVSPTEAFYKSTVNALKRILKTDFEIKEHLSSIRPAAVERKPFAGIHPAYNQIAILNGMGSKGCSLAPWFARELAAHLINKEPINPLADVKRYTNVLKRE